MGFEARTGARGWPYGGGDVHLCIADLWGKSRKGGRRSRAPLRRLVACVREGERRDAACTCGLLGPRVGSPGLATDRLEWCPMPADRSEGRAPYGGGRHGGEEGECSGPWAGEERVGPGGRWMGQGCWAEGKAIGLGKGRQPDWGSFLFCF